MSDKEQRIRARAYAIWEQRAATTDEPRSIGAKPNTNRARVDVSAGTSR